MSQKRQDRINEMVKQTISEIVREMKDPRISPMTTIMSAEVTNDYNTAKVKVSVYDKDDSVRVNTVEALNKAAGYIARELGMRMDIRRLPKLNFILDNSIEYSVHISAILNELNKARPKEDDAEESEEE